MHRLSIFALLALLSAAAAAAAGAPAVGPPVNRYIPAGTNRMQDELRAMVREEVREQVRALRQADRQQDDLLLAGLQAQTERMQGQIDQLVRDKSALENKMQGNQGDVVAPRQRAARRCCPQCFAGIVYVKDSA